jgi:hypothetical protein
MSNSPDITRVAARVGLLIPLRPGMSRHPPKTGEQTRMARLAAGAAKPAAELSLSKRERVLLFSVASGTDWQNAGITSETVMGLIIKDLFERDTAGRLKLTDRGRTALQRLLPDL